MAGCLLLVDLPYVLPAASVYTTCGSRAWPEIWFINYTVIEVLVACTGAGASRRRWTGADDWTDKLTDGRTDGRTNERTDERTDDGRTDGRTNGGTVGRTNGR